MINIAQTLKYIELCKSNNVAIVPRTIETVESAFGDIHLSMKDSVILGELLTTPNTAGAYMELLRIQISLRALGELDKYHPCSLINVSNFQDTLREKCETPESVIALGRQYDIGDLSLYGSLIHIAESVYESLDTNKRLDDVFVNSNLSRLLSLYEYIISDGDKEVGAAVACPVTLPHITKAM